MKTKHIEFLPKLIIDLISAKLDVSYSTMISKSRIREHVFARQVSMFFIKKYTDLNLTQIGCLFNRDHSTVIYAIETINDIQIQSQYKLKICELDSNVYDLIKVKMTDELMQRLMFQEIERINTIRKYNHLPSHELARMILSNAV